MTDALDTLIEAVKVDAATLKDRDGIEARRIAAAQALASDIRKRCAAGEDPYRLRDVMRGRGLVSRVSCGAITLSGHQIHAVRSLSGTTPDWAEMKAALIAWADTADTATPRVATDGE